MQNLGWISLLIMMNFFWAGAYAITKWGLGSLNELSLVFWRFSIAFVFLLVALIFKRQSLKVAKNDLIRILVTGFLLGISHILWVTGINLSSAVNASLLYVFEPIWGIILARLILKEKTNWSTYVGLVLVIVGMLVLSNFDLEAFGLKQGSNLLGNALIVLGLISEAFFSILLKPAALRVPATVLMSGVLFIATIVLSSALFIMKGFEIPSTTPGLIAVLYLAVICTVLGYTLWVHIMKHVPVGVMFFTIFIQPVAGPIIAAMTIGEKINTQILIAATFLIGGMTVAVVGHVRQVMRDRVAFKDDVISVLNTP